MPQEKRLLRVPWGGDTVVQVMFFWVVAFCFLGSCVVPVAQDLLGLDRMDLTPRLKARPGGLFPVGGLSTWLTCLQSACPCMLGLGRMCVMPWLKAHVGAASRQPPCPASLLSASACSLSCCTACTAQCAPLTLHLVAVQALSHLVLDTLQMGSTLAILWACLRRHRQQVDTQRALQVACWFCAPSCHTCYPMTITSRELVDLDHLAETDPLRRNVPAAAAGRLVPHGGAAAAAVAAAYCAGLPPLPCCQRADCSHAGELYSIPPALTVQQSDPQLLSFTIWHGSPSDTQDFMPAGPVPRERQPLVSRARAVARHWRPGELRYHIVFTIVFVKRAG